MSAPSSGAPRGTVLFVHGSSMASQPTFDLQVPGRPDSSVMDWFAARGFDAWCLDNEGYGRSDKSRPINFDISNGADDLEAASRYVLAAARADLRVALPEANRPSVNDFVIRAVAMAARERPDMVSRLEGEEFVVPGSIDVGVAVAVPGGLIVPVLRDADANSMSHALELRVPFLDRALVETVTALPGRFKQSPRGPGKRLLRAAMNRHLPSEVKSRRPTEITRGTSAGRLSNTVGRPSGSECVVTRPRGLW